MKFGNHLLIFLLKCLLFLSVAGCGCPKQLWECLILAIRTGQNRRILYPEEKRFLLVLAAILKIRVDAKFLRQFHI